MWTGTVTESQQPTETGCSAALPAVPFLLPTCLVWKTPKVGTVYRAIACKTFPRSPTYVPYMLQSCVLTSCSCKKKKKKAFCLFSNTSISRGSEGAAWICAPWQSLAQMCISGKSCLRKTLPQSGLSDSEVIMPSVSPLFCSSVQTYVRGVCLVVGELFSGEEEEERIPAPANFSERS